MFGRSNFMDIGGNQSGLVGTSAIIGGLNKETSDVFNYSNANSTMETLPQPSFTTHRGPTFGEIPSADVFSVDPTGHFGGGFLTTQSTGQVNGWQNKTTLLALKIGMINKAWLLDITSSQISIMGIQVEHLKIVGHIRSVQEHENKYVILVDDGTGVIGCDYMVPDESTSNKKKDMQDLMMAPDVYVKVYGGINLLGKKTPHIRAHAIRKIEHYDELALHDIEVCHFVKKRRQQLQQKEAMRALPQHALTADIPSSLVPGRTQAVQNPFAAASSPDYSEMARAAFSNTAYSSAETYPPHDSSFVKRTEVSSQSIPVVINSILQEQRRAGNFNGLHRNQILHLVRKRTNNSALSEPEVYQSLKLLGSQGVVYNTIDVDTYGSTGA